MKNISGARFLHFVLIALFLQSFIAVEALSEEKSNTISDKIARNFEGVWKVKIRGSNLLFGASVTSSIWVIRRKGKKLIVDIPEAGLVFEDLTIKGRNLSQTLITEKKYDVDTKEESSINLEVVDGLFDGVFVEKGSRKTVTGRHEPLYKLALNAEKVFVRKLDAEKKRLGEGIKKLELYEKQIAGLKLKLKEKGSREDWEKERNKDLRSLQNRNSRKNKNLTKKHRSIVKQLKSDLNRELKRPPQLNVSRLPRDAQAYKSTDLKANPTRDARSYFRIRKNQTLIRLANIDNGWSLVATDRGDMGFVVTTHLRTITGSAPPVSSSSSSVRNENASHAEIEDDKSPQLINLVSPRRGKGSKRHNILIPAAGFVTLRGNLVGSKVKLFTINGEKVDIASGNSFRHLMDITQDGQIIKFVAITTDGQQRLDLRARIAF